jgi:predicted metal-dependent hydrolase
MLVDKIIHSHRKTIAVIVQRDGKVIVRAPRGMANDQIRRFVDEKNSWIRKKKEVALHRHAAASRHYAPGELFSYLGHNYPLVISKGSGPDLALRDNQFYLAQTVLPNAPQVFTAWYQKQAHRVIPPRTRALADQFSLSFERVRISSARTRWGSCSTRGTLSFVWRLVMAPPEVIDYVIIHELAHTVVQNHSARFWAKVAELMPEYTARLEWLKENGYRLSLE